MGTNSSANPAFFSPPKDVRALAPEYATEHLTVQCSMSLIDQLRRTSRLHHLLLQAYLGSESEEHSEPGEADRERYHELLAQTQEPTGRGESRAWRATAASDEVPTSLPHCLLTSCSCPTVASCIDDLPSHNGLFDGRRGLTVKKQMAVEIETWSCRSLSAVGSTSSRSGLKPGWRAREVGERTLSGKPTSRGGSACRPKLLCDQKPTDISGSCSSLRWD